MKNPVQMCERISPWTENATIVGDIVPNPTHVAGDNGQTASHALQDGVVRRGIAKGHEQHRGRPVLVQERLVVTIEHGVQA